MSASRSRPEVEAELLEWMREGAAAQPDAKRFERIARSLFEIQYEACIPYARLCRSVERTPDSVTRVEEIPAVPAGAFKEFDLRCFPDDATLKTFRTSGTSSDRRGQLHLDRLDLYEASLLASLHRCFLADLIEPDSAPVDMRFLAPPPSESPDSSLTHMFECLRQVSGSQASGFDLREGELDWASFARAVERSREQDTPLVVAGTSFAFVHFLDGRGGVEGRDDGADQWHLPRGSRVMETGGFKGRSRSVPREILRADIAACFGLDEQSVVNQYGMTELGSQFYDSTLIDPDGPRRKLSPPWARVRFVDPESGNDVAPGEVGMIVIHDLANTGSIAAIQTADLGRAILSSKGEPIGFDVLGREAGAEARGCSIATDVMLEASGGAGSS